MRRTHARRRRKRRQASIWFLLHLAGGRDRHLSLHLGLLSFCGGLESEGRCPANRSDPQNNQRPETVPTSQRHFSADVQSGGSPSLETSESAQLRLRRSHP